ncbi:MAG: hypothetical protein JSU77_05845 [Fidelibacterota bacterium]|nr:MAG: hypothetical protein JSU77_05845 [Candidatus Neomarinimicrobiota bacterium]
MKKTVILVCTALLTAAFADGETFSGIVFYDYTYDLAGEGANEFAINRIYFTYGRELSAGIKYKFQTDVGRIAVPTAIDTTTGKLTASSETQLLAYMKNAKVDWNTDLGLLTIGIQGMNVFNVQEKTWGFRFLDKTPMDRYKFASSADMGIGYSNTLIDNLHISVLLTNGTSYKEAEDDTHKKFSAQVVYGEKDLLSKNGFNAGGTFTREPYDVNSGTEDRILYGVFGGFAGDKLRIGGEFDQLIDAGSDRTKQIIATYASFKISDKFEAHGYFDMYDANTKTTGDEDNQSYIIAGVNYYPGKGLIIAPNIRYTKPEAGAAETLFKVNFQFKY